MLTNGDRTLAVAAARVWNSLLRHVTLSSSLEAFKSRLKTRLFMQHFLSHHSTHVYCTP